MLLLSDMMIFYMKKTLLANFIDWSKAFYTIDYYVLLHKLKYDGIDELACKLSKKYFSNRRQ